MIFGVDSHKSTLSICGIDPLGRRVCAATLANTRRGHEQLLAFVREFAAGEAALIGVEGAGKYGYALSRFLVAAGMAVADVPPKLTDRERQRLRGAGKSDERDALAIARIVAREPERFPLISAQADQARDLKLLSEYRRQLVAQRTRTANRLHADLVALAPGYEASCPTLQGKNHLAAAGRILGRVASGVQRDLARERLAELRRLDQKLAELKKRLTAALLPTKTSLLELPGAGVLTAAVILGQVGDVRRFQTRNQFARVNGTAPIPASTGKNPRQRLNPGGNRQLNHAIHTIALVQLRCDERARAFVAARRARGQTYRDALRSLKRHISDAVFAALRDDADRAAGEPVTTRPGVPTAHATTAVT